MKNVNLSIESTLDEARDALSKADALVIGAGAGFGVDSGLPDFRGVEGFWNAYPPYRNLGLDFTSLANPRPFKKDPAVAWGFYGHRQALYRETVPHDGFRLLREFSETLTRGAFVFTSNVDGQFAKAGFLKDRIVECHGTIHHLQCTVPCNDSIWPAAFSPDVDITTMRAEGRLPKCPSCSAVARPNILMFGDSAWIERRTGLQEMKYNAWLSKLGNARLVVIEFGAGGTIPTVRENSAALVHQLGATLIRVNPREPEGPPGTLSLPLRGLEACVQLFEA